MKHVSCCSFITFAIIALHQKHLAQTTNKQTLVSDNLIKELQSRDFFPSLTQKKLSSFPDCNEKHFELLSLSTPTINGEISTRRQS
jgi:hypothetical protein